MGTFVVIGAIIRLPIWCVQYVFPYKMPKKNIIRFMHTNCVKTLALKCATQMYYACILYGIHSRVSSDIISMNVERTKIMRKP